MKIWIILLVFFLTSSIILGSEFTEKATKIILKERGDNNEKFAKNIAISVERWAKVYGIDEYFVMAVLSVESWNFLNRYNYRDDSYGLGAIRPITGRWICQKLRIEFDLERLVWDVDYNIRLCVWYLAWLCERFDSMEQVIAAYNQGHNAVRKRLSKGTFLKIPRHRVHVQRVLSKYGKYSGSGPR